MNSLPQPDLAEQFMRRAVDQALLGKGRTAPNPCVGAVLTSDDVVVAEGYHAGPGLAHAEVEAIAQARARNVDLTRCTLWVTLEPCNHQGRTPPCTQAVLEAGIPRVVVGALDPNPHVPGQGARFLQERGVDVHIGVAAIACRDLIADFITWMQTPLPYVYLKLAATVDGRIATRCGDSQWISGEQSRSQVHALRSRVNAVMVGAGTMRADNPRLTCRVNGEQDPQKQPLAVVVGTRLPEPDADLFLIRQRPEQTIFLVPADVADTVQGDALRSLGCRIWGCARGSDPNRIDLVAAMARLRSELGVYEVLCEGGGRLAGALVQSGLVGEWWLFQSPKTLGDEQARPVLAGAAVERMDQAGQWRFARILRVGRDVLLVLRPTGVSLEGWGCSRG